MASDKVTQTITDLSMLKKIMEAEDNSAIRLYSGISQVPDEAIINMMVTKSMYDRIDGTQLHMLRIDIKKESQQHTVNEVPVQNCCTKVDPIVFAKSVSAAILDYGFQHYAAIHETDSNWRLQFTLNSVNFLTGRRSSNTSKLSRYIQDFVQVHYPEITHGLDWSIGI